jgi:hypothetical protein
MASTSTPTTPSVIASWDEYKYFKEFTRLVAVKREKSNHRQNIWLRDTMPNTLILAETLIRVPADIETPTLTAGDFLIDIYFICSTLRFAKKNHQHLYTSLQAKRKKPQQLYPSLQEKKH